MPSVATGKGSDTVFSVATAEEKPGASWHLFNDFLVKALSEEEVLSFPGKWKVRAWLLDLIPCGS